jgi:hypothetical protein
MVPAAGNGDAVAPKERPILWTPVIEPKPVLCNDGLANFFESAGSWVWNIYAELPRELCRDQLVPARRDLQAVIRNIFEPGEIDGGIAELTNRDGVFGQKRVVLCEIREGRHAAFEWRRDDQKNAGCLIRETRQKFRVRTGELVRLSLFKRFGTPELAYDDRDAGFLQVMLDWREAEIARLGKDSVAFPPEITETQIQRRVLDRQQRFQMAALLGGNNVRAPEESDNVVRAKSELRRRGRGDQAREQGKAHAGSLSTHRRKASRLTAGKTVP